MNVTAPSVIAAGTTVATSVISSPVIAAATLFTVVGGAYIYTHPDCRVARACKAFWKEMGPTQAAITQDDAKKMKARAQLYEAAAEQGAQIAENTKQIEKLSSDVEKAKSLIARFTQAAESNDPSDAMAQLTDSDASTALKALKQVSTSKGSKFNAKKVAEGIQPKINEAALTSNFDQTGLYKPAWVKGGRQAKRDEIRTALSDKGYIADQINAVIKELRHL